MMTNKEFKDKTISDLFKSRTFRLKIEAMLFRAGLGRKEREFIEADIISETFLELSKMDADRFYDKFYNNWNHLEATTLVIAKRTGLLNSSNKNSNLPPRPNKCVKDNLSFASSYKSGHNNVIEPTENNADYNGMGSDGVSNPVLAESLSDVNDKNQVFEYLKSRLTTEEVVILDMLTDHKLRPGKKKAVLQVQIDEVKSKVKELLNDYSKNYYKQKAWKIGEEMSMYKNAKYKYVDEQNTQNI
jgi:hypothetical protein